MKWYIRRFIENELKAYKAMVEEYDSLRDDILNESPPPPNGMPRGSETSDSTFSRASRLISHNRLRHLETTTKAIERVLECLTPDKMKLIELKYWAKPQTLTDEGIALAIGCGPATVYRWTREILSNIAYEMGLEE